jgi:hypothetical protein
VRVSLADDRRIAGTSMKVFVSYRVSDSQGTTHLLATTLKQQLGNENVFFDLDDLAKGTKWREEIVRRVEECDALVAVIGPNWVGLAGRRDREDDVLRVEIETALSRGKHVIPILVDGAVRPIRDQLFRPFRPLLDRQDLELRHGSWEQDVRTLVARLEQMGPAVPQATPTPTTGPAYDHAGLDDDEYEQVVEYLRDGSLVIVLGSELNAAARVDGAPALRTDLPSVDELASRLAERFRLPEAVRATDLAQISQYVTVRHKGRIELNKALCELVLAPDAAPGAAHRALARLPRLLRNAGCENYPLILTTNYDAALERAFDEVYEPYDLAIFLAAGEHRGRFLHVSWWPEDGETESVITEPNTYRHFPFDENGLLERVLIVKVHGGPVDTPTHSRLLDNFVITEDDYIGYLSPGSAEGLVPTQILGKVRDDGHFLFLAHGVRDWNLRVFYQRIWGDGRPPGISWVVQPRPDPLDRGFWENLGVNFVGSPTAAYLEELERRLVAHRPIVPA